MYGIRCILIHGVGEDDARNDSHRRICSFLDVRNVLQRETDLGGRTCRPSLSGHDTVDDQETGKEMGVCVHVKSIPPSQVDQIAHVTSSHRSTRHADIRFEITRDINLI
jgi:hypothetical protein